MMQAWATATAHPLSRGSRFQAFCQAMGRCMQMGLVAASVAAPWTPVWGQDFANENPPSQLESPRALIPIAKWAWVVPETKKSVIPRSLVPFVARQSLPTQSPQIAQIPTIEGAVESIATSDFVESSPNDSAGHSASTEEDLASSAAPAADLAASATDSSTPEDNGIGDLTNDPRTPNVAADALIEEPADQLSAEAPLVSNVASNTPIAMRISDDDEIQVDSGSTATVSPGQAIASLVEFLPVDPDAASTLPPIRSARINVAQPTQPPSLVPAPGKSSSDASSTKLPMPTPFRISDEPTPPPEEIYGAFKTIGTLGTRVRPKEAEERKNFFPVDPARKYFEKPAEPHPPGMRREWAYSTYAWVAPDLCHRPLYFEDVNLERHGHSFGPLLQPGVSAVHFFVRVPLLPYLWTVSPPQECVYTLGHYRPGSYAPFHLHRPPLRASGAAVEAATIAAIFLIFP